MDQSPTLWRQSRGTWASTPSTFVRGVDGPGLNKSPTLRHPSQGTWAVPLCCQNLQKGKKCRTHLTTQSPAGIFIELSMKSPGARVPAREKIPVSGLSGPLAPAQTPARHRKKKSGGGSLGLRALTPPRCGSGRPPCHVCGWEIWAVTTAPGQLWTGGSLCCFLGCAIPPVPAMFCYSEDTSPAP